MNQAQPTIYFVFLHTTGENWTEGKPFLEQKGAKEHADYHAKYLKERKLLMGGPFINGQDIGMTIYNINDQEEANKIAYEDPGVKSKLLNVEVRQWIVPLRSN
jgi:uncharacterized protein YciI